MSRHSPPTWSSDLPPHWDPRAAGDQTPEMWRTLGRIEMHTAQIAHGQDEITDSLREVDRRLAHKRQRLDLIEHRLSSLETTLAELPRSIAPPAAAPSVAAPSSSPPGSPPVPDPTPLERVVKQVIAWSVAIGAVILALRGEIEMGRKMLEGAVKLGGG